MPFSFALNFQNYSHYLKNEIKFFICLKFESFKDYSLVTSSQALGKLSNHALKLKQELQNVLKNIPMSNVGTSQKASVKVSERNL